MPGRTPAWQKKYELELAESFNEETNLRCASGTAARSRPTVDVVPQCNRQWLRCGGALEVGINLADQVIQEVQTTMDVADDIDPRSVELGSIVHFSGPDHCAR